jgi:hypothetical protein
VVAAVQYVLYGIFPAVLLGAGITWLVIKYKRQPLKVLASAHAAETWGTDLKTVYRFKNKEQVGCTSTGSSAPCPALCAHA